MSDCKQDGPLRRTPLYEQHVSLGGRMVPFAGYEMPVQYPSGIVKEHLHVRATAGLFDVSHMGQFEIRPRNGNIETAARALESVLPIDVLGLASGRQRYALLTNEQGGVRDDLMIARMDDRFLIVANAASKKVDEEYLRATIGANCEIEHHEERALLALQGPLSESVLTELFPDVRAMRFMDVRTFKIHNAACVISRSGYTGEDGFEISAPAEAGNMIARDLLRNPHVAAIGLGARDSLRLEAGLCLYGPDLDLTTTPVEAALEWSIQSCRRFGGSRAGGFPGASIIMDQLQNGAPRRRVGLRPDGRAPVRHGARLFRDRDSAESIGIINSGGFGPSVNAPVAMGYVASSEARRGDSIFAELRGDRVPMQLSKLPFVPFQFKR